MQPETALLKWCLFGPGWLHSIFHYSQTVISVRIGGGGRGGLFQSFWVDIISWPLWQQSKRAAQHLKNISQEPAQLAHSFKYRPNTLALLPGRTDIRSGTYTHVHQLYSFPVTGCIFFPLQWNILLIAAEEGPKVFYLFTFTVQCVEVWTQRNHLLSTLEFFHERTFLRKCAGKTAIFAVDLKRFLVKDLKLGVKWDL